MHRIPNIQIDFANRIRIANQVVRRQIAILLADFFPKSLPKFDDLYLLLRRNAHRCRATEHRQFRLVPDLRVNDVAWARGLRCRSLHHFRFFSRQDVPHRHAPSGMAPKHFVKTNRLRGGLLDKKPVQLGKPLRLLPNVATSDQAASVSLLASRRTLRVPLEQVVGHEKPALFPGVVERLGEVAHAEILPCFQHQFSKLASGKLHHLPDQPCRLFMLPLPHAVDGRLACQAAMLVFASAATGTGVVSANLLAGMGSHDVATLSCPACGRQGATVAALPGAIISGLTLCSKRMSRASTQIRCAFDAASPSLWPFCCLWPQSR